MYMYVCMYYKNKHYKNKHYKSTKHTTKQPNIVEHLMIE